MSWPPARSSLVWALVIANIFAVCLVAWLSWRHEAVVSGLVRVTPLEFADLPGWSTSDSHGALAAFVRSCDVITKFAKDRPMGGLGYAGSAADWFAPCKALARDVDASTHPRSYFERWFAPVEVRADPAPLFTGYYEPVLTGSRTKTPRFRVPIYGRPSDLVTVDLSLFRRLPAGTRIYGRLSGTELVPYPSRADIDSAGLPQAPILLYTDDPVGAFFLGIQGSGRVRFENGTVSRLSFSATNGRRYTSIGRVLIARRALDRRTVSLQTIAAWLNAHPADAQKVLEEDQSFVFFALAPLGDPALGSSGTEGVPLTAGASAAVDVRANPLGVPIYVATRIPGSAPLMPEKDFNNLLIAQDTGGDIKGAVRADIFFGSGGEAETIAGHLKSRGRFFVLLPRPLAAALEPHREFPEPSQ